VIMSVTDIDFTALTPFLARRAAASYKGDFGHSLLIGGNFGFAGSIMMAAIAAARAGSGLISVATRGDNVISIVTRYPEIMAHDVDNTAGLESLLKKATVIGVGPGLGQSDWSQILLDKVWQQELPLIVDADALNLLAKLPQRRDNWILTPHAGEAARLLGVEVKAILAERDQAVVQLQQRYGGIAILKGQHTLVATGNGIFRCTAGNPGMASGGMGDTLTGIITGLVAQNIPLPIAAQLGVYLHARAGDEAAQAGERGLLASDLLPYIRQLVNPDNQ